MSDIKYRELFEFFKKVDFLDQSFEPVTKTKGKELTFSFPVFEDLKKHFNDTTIANGIGVHGKFNDDEIRLFEYALTFFKDCDFSGWRIVPLYIRSIAGACDGKRKLIEIRHHADTYYSDDEYVFTLVHELRHAFQAMAGKLIFHTSRHVTWSDTGEDFKSDIERVTHERYINFPWERDANGYAFACVDLSPDSSFYRYQQHAKIMF